LKPRIYIGVGSNIDPERNIPAALRLLRDAGAILGAISNFYRTAPLGSPGAPPFHNGVLRIETRLAPRALKFDVLRPIEDALGRQRSADKNAPRPIDLDLLLYGDRVIDEPGLRIPDLEILERPFLAIALHELAPDLVVPGAGRRLSDSLPARPADMIPLLDFTRRLREESGIA